MALATASRRPFPGGAALDHPAAAAQSQVGGDGPVLVLCVVGGSDIQRGRVVDVVVLKHLQHLLDGEFPVVVVADLLDPVAQLLPQCGAAGL